MTERAIGTWTDQFDLPSFVVLNSLKMARLCRNT